MQDRWQEGSHTFTVRVTDAATNSSTDSYTWVIDTTAPTVVSITRVDPDPTSASNVDFTVTFSETVTGVNKADFTLTISGVSGVYVSSVGGSGDTYTVTVNTGSGNGTIRLDVVDDNSIVDAANNPLGGSSVGDGDFAGGEEYAIVKSKPSIPVLLSPFEWQTRGYPATHTGLERFQP